MLGRTLRVAAVDIMYVVKGLHAVVQSVKRQEDTVHPPSFQNESNTTRRTAQRPLKAGAKNRTGSWE